MLLFWLIGHCPVENVGLILPAKHVPQECASYYIDTSHYVRNIYSMQNLLLRFVIYVQDYIFNSMFNRQITRGVDFLSLILKYQLRAWMYFPVITVMLLVIVRRHALERTK